MMEGVVSATSEGIGRAKQLVTCAISIFARSTLSSLESSYMEEGNGSPIVNEMANHSKHSIIASQEKKMSQYVKYCVLNKHELSA